jgi:hypothetical protein
MKKCTSVVSGKSDVMLTTLFSRKYLNRKITSIFIKGFKYTCNWNIRTYSVFILQLFYSRRKHKMFKYVFRERFIVVFCIYKELPLDSNENGPTSWFMVISFNSNYMLDHPST